MGPAAGAASQAEAKQTVDNDAMIDDCLGVCREDHMVDGLVDQIEAAEVEAAEAELQAVATRKAADSSLAAADMVDC